MRHSEAEIEMTPEKVFAVCCGRQRAVHPQSTPEVNSDAVYHAAETYVGDEYTFDAGGVYEKVECGKLVYATDEKRRVKLHDTPQLAASNTPEACIIARIDNNNKATGGPGLSQPCVSVYEITKKPDVDLTECADRDFSVLEEVRFNNPEENPVHATHHMTIVLPQRVSKDVFQIYNTDVDVAGAPTPEHDGWYCPITADAVKKSIRAYINTGEYPDPVTHIDTKDT